MMIRQILIVGLFLIACVVMAQDTAEPSARGIIPIPTSDIRADSLVLNPLFCQSEFCRFISPLLFPSLVEHDLMDGSLQLANDENFALIADIEQSEDGDSYIYTLRDDAMWSDGIAITAYDVFFSYLAIINRQTASSYRGEVIRQLDALVPLSDSKLLVIPHDLDCDIPSRVNFPVIPVHKFDDNFASRVEEFFDDDNITLDDFDAWIDNDTFVYQSIINHDFSYAPTSSYGKYQFTGQSAQDYVRLANVDDLQVLETVTYSRGQSGIDAVIAGEIAYYENPPRNQWEDLRNNPNITAVTLPTDSWYYIAFNFADPREPLSYRDRDGEIQEQEPHPILINPDVRRAIQLGIDVQALVDTALWGEGEVMAGYSLPSSWAHNPALDPIIYDPDAAAALLEAANWRQLSPLEARQCIDCGTAADNHQLGLQLLYDADNEVDRMVASLIAQQLVRIGVNVRIRGVGNVENEAQLQQFDMYLGRSQLSVPFEPDTSFFFLPENDVLNRGANVGSYDNPDITALYNEARLLDGCDINERQTLYYQLEEEVQSAQPFVWLFTPYEMTVFHTSIHNIETYPNRPIANIDKWSVWTIP